MHYLGVPKRTSMALQSLGRVNLPFLTSSLEGLFDGRRSTPFVQLAVVYEFLCILCCSSEKHGSISHTTKGSNRHSPLSAYF